MINDQQYADAEKYLKEKIPQYPHANWMQFVLVLVYAFSGQFDEFEAQVAVLRGLNRRRYREYAKTIR